MTDAKERNCARSRGIVGARRWRLGEPLAWVETYPIQWRELRVDLAELARLRWIDGYSTGQLAKRYGKTTVAIQNYYQELKRKKFQIPGLTPEFERRIASLDVYRKPRK